ncbi:MAG TPA: hypothetical protein VNA12_03765 [Mycobacteriales bacterium]|nr:hypothetical protein [Mycobacteriales bacterium]
MTEVRYQVGAQLAADGTSPAATVAAYDRLVREVTAAGTPEAMWTGRPAAGRVEVMLVVEALDAEHALSTALTALRGAARAMGRALPSFGFRSLAAQPLGNPDDWADRAE